jgi:transposase InsO family protein
VWLPTSEGKPYCCAIHDVFSYRIVGCSIAERMTADLATAALRSAVARRQPEERSWCTRTAAVRFRSRKFRAVLKANTLTRSM